MNRICTQFEELLSARLDGELDPREEELVTAHLRSCNACRGILEDLKYTQALLRNLDRVPAPESLWPRIKSKMPVRNPAFPARGSGPASLNRGRPRMGTVSVYIRASKRLAALAASLVVLIGLITLLGYIAPESVSARDSNIYFGEHAYHLMRQPLVDRSSWSYTAGESNFELLSAEE